MALMKRKRIGMNDAMSVVTRFVNACNRHDADGVAACLHPNFDSIQPMYPSRNFRGADQVRRNWQAIFDAEPGFRLTVLRSAAMDDTVWLELHGAGRDAEVAGIFIMGIVGDRIRWARIYSALVEPVVPGVGDATDPAASLQEVPRPDESAATGSGDVVQEDLIAPVVDIERSGRRRRRRRGAADDGGEGVEAQPAAEAATVGDVPEAEASPESEVAEEVTVEREVATVVVTEEAGQPEPVAVVDEDSGPPTEAVEMVTLTEPDPEPDPDPEPEAEVPANDAVPEAAAEEPEAVAEPAAEAPKRRFGKRGRD